MNVKVVNRYVELLTDIIDKKVRIEGNKTTFDKQYILSVMKRYEDETNKITEKIYKQTVKWFIDREILDTDGATSNLRYKIHSDFKYVKSKSRETVIRQCKFIIGQLALYSDHFWDEGKELYEDIVLNTDTFKFISHIKSQSVKDTVSSLVIHKHNGKFEGKYTYELLQTLQSSKTPFNITIQNESIDTKLSGVKVKKIQFRIDSVSLSFSNSQFELESLSDIKKIQIPIQKDIYKKIDKSLEYLQSFDNESSKKLRDLLNEYKVGRELFFNDITEEKS